jgi:hypothetical protein
MLRPSPDEVVAIKAACRAKFGHDRVIGIPLGEPIDLFVAVAAFSGVKDASVYVDARTASSTGPMQARSALIVERCLWPSQAELAAVRRLRGVLDAKIEEYFRAAMGWSGDDNMASAVRFSAATAPPGFAAPAELAGKVNALFAAHPAAELWSVTNQVNGLALVIANPEEVVHTAFSAAFAELQKSRRGALTLSLDFLKDFIVWSPKPVDAYFDEAPGRAEDLTNPLLEMGGAAATGSASFL